MSIVRNFALICLIVLGQSAIAGANDQEHTTAEDLPRLRRLS